MKLKLGNVFVHFIKRKSAKYINMPRQYRVQKEQASIFWYNTEVKRTESLYNQFIF